MAVCGFPRNDNCRDSGSKTTIALPRRLQDQRMKTYLVLSHIRSLQDNFLRIGGVWYERHLTLGFRVGHVYMLVFSSSHLLAAVNDRLS